MIVFSNNLVIVYFNNGNKLQDNSFIQPAFLIPTLTIAFIVQTLQNVWFF